MRPRHAAALLALAALPVLAGCGSSNSSSAAPSTSTSTGTAKQADTTSKKYAAPAQASPARMAPNFTLRDSLGKQVSLSDYRGKAVLLTFIYDHCPDTCPLMVGNLHNALAQLGPKASQAQVIAVSVDPKGDTPKTVKKFLADHEMTGRMEYLIGSKAQLAPVWKRYNIGVKGSPEEREGDTNSKPVAHSALVYGITGSGKTTTLYPANFKPQWVAHDVPLLAAS